MVHARGNCAVGLARWVAALGAVAAALAGCATRPVAEFGAYREAFDAARQAGEAVLLDYSGAVRVYEESLPGARGSAEDEFDFDAVSVFAGDAAPDDIGVRFAAWRVIADYNAALTALIEGRSSAEVSAAVDGLLGSLREFPVAALADAAGDLAPFGGLITAVLREVQRAYEAEQFREAVLAGSELIPGFVSLCVADAQNFYGVRRGLRDRARDPIMDAIASDARLFRARVSELAREGGEGSAETVGGLVEEFNRALEMSHAENRDVGAGMGEEALAAGLTPAGTASLRAIVERADERARLAAALDAELLAYRDVLASYVRMLRELESATATLRAAAERRVLTLAPAGEIFRAAVETRRALAAYEEAGNR